jgi:hypothetical protein
MEVYALWEEMIKTKANMENLLKKNKDLDPMYVSNKSEEHDELVHHILYCIPNNRWKILMLNLMGWELA